MDLSKHPAIAGFLLTLPSVNVWSSQEWEEWFAVLHGIMRIVYGNHTTTTQHDTAARNESASALDLANSGSAKGDQELVDSAGLAPNERISAPKEDVNGNS